MMKKQRLLYNAGLTAMIWILVFQNPLESVWDPFSYIDEGMALLGAFLGMYDIVFVRKCRLSKDQLWMGIPLLIFVVAGLTGNLIYQYQPLKCVIIDLYTNLKFFFAIGTGYHLFAKLNWEETEEVVRWNSAVITTILFVLFLVDQVFHFWPSEIRYGIYSAKLFYFHPTYLAAVMAFLLVLETVFYQKKNIPFMAMAVIVMVFTFRAKAIASVAIFVAIFLFVLLWKRKIKLWYIVFAAVACVIIAWPQISFYFFELGDRSTRSVMHGVAFQIAKDYFPIGTGFGTYASAEAAKTFSPVYELYNFEYLLRFEINRQWLGFLDDTFWPIIIGQTGAIGTTAYVATLGFLFSKCWRIQNMHIYSFAAVLYIWAHLMICSVAEPAFNNSTAIPLAVTMGIVLCTTDSHKNLQHHQKRIDNYGR